MMDSPHHSREVVLFQSRDFVDFSGPYGCESEIIQVKWIIKKKTSNQTLFLIFSGKTVLTTLTSICIELGKLM